MLPTGGHGLLRDDVDLLSLGETGVLLVDRRTGESYTIGHAEKQLLELLASDKSLDEVIASFSDETDNAVSRRHVLEFVDNLQHLGLLRGQGPNTMLAPSESASVNGHASGRLNVVFDLLAMFFGWIDHWTVVLAIGLAVLVGANVGFRHSDAILQDMEAFSRVCPFWIWLPFIELPKLLLLDLMYTLVLGIVSRGRGANLRRFGFQWWQGVLPIFKLDLGASFTLMDRRDRRALTWATLLFPLAVGSLALIGWRTARPGSSAAIVCLLFVPVSMIWFLVQANPFTRGSSGQYLLCDVTRQRDIQTWAMEEVNAWILGRRRPRALSPRERFWFRVYGLAYWLYRLALNVVTLVVAHLGVIPRYGAPGALLVVGVLVYLNSDVISAITRALTAPLQGRTARQAR